MKKMKKIKRIGAILLIFLLNINTLATSISDNDGSAFITKAEFDALKSSFQAQIDAFNQGIDSTIDAAIAAYLSGIKIRDVSTLVNQYKSLGKVIQFGVVPFNTTVNNKVYSLNCAGAFYSDGYPNGERMAISNWQGSKDNITSSGENNAFNWAENVSGKYFYLQNSKKSYIATYYNFTGAGYINGNKQNANINMADGSDLRNLSKKWNASDDWTWNQKIDFSDYIYSRSNTWPAEYDYIRGNVVHVWQPGVITDTSIYAQAFLLSDNNAYNELIIKSEKDEDYCGTIETMNPNLSLACVNYEQGGASSVKFNGNIAYYSVKTTRVNLTNLYQKIVKDRLGMTLKLYEGMPLFETDKNDGEATFDCTIHNTDAGYVKIYFRDTLFTNTDTNTGKIGLNGSYLVDNGNPDVKNWNKYNFSDGLITLSTSSSGTKIRVIFKAEKNKNYYFKLVPSSTTKFAWMSDCSDITFEAD